ncbi:hypothetical protein TWF192_005788 [Orbilia oligospora]|uniref:Uncharacterized protein n=1 Tax=Orbilia oligospora TaxID=2813651 RepID=A0A6G1MND0_ORBOL|nr:hypothetical protein TWF191_003854 [Orbilia oligospora]KAF3263507.1 hypothetical protein TWF192_005788 [Orbilia oligospora]
MQSLVDSSVFGALGGKKSKNEKARGGIRRSGAVTKRDAAQESPSSSKPLSTPKIALGLPGKQKGKQKGKTPQQTIAEEEDWPFRDFLQSGSESSPPISPLLSPVSSPSTTFSKYVDAPVDERDEIIEALTSTLENELYSKTKARWGLNEDYLEELDTIAPSILQEKFHDKITAISTKFFPKSITWKILSSQLAPRINNLGKMSYFPDGVKLPCTLETWDAVQQHPDMTSSLFVEGVISNTLAYGMGNAPVFQAEGLLGIDLGIFHYHCKAIHPGGPQGAEWTALTLQMIEKMLQVSNEADSKQKEFSDIKPIERSNRTRKLVWTLMDTLRILREAVQMPFGTKEWDTLQEMTQDLVSETFKLSIQWHSKPLSFGQHGMSWFSQKTIQNCSKILGYNLDNESTILNWEDRFYGQEKNVIAVISPMFFREEWDGLGEAQSRVRIWKVPRLLVIPQLSTT